MKESIRGLKKQLSDKNKEIASLKEKILEDINVPACEVCGNTFEEGDVAYDIGGDKIHESCLGNWARDQGSCTAVTWEWLTGGDN